VAAAIYLALAMRRPLLIDGEAGVGKTEVAKTLARLKCAAHIRLQSYEGIDARQARSDWNYAQQLRYIPLLQAAELDPCADVDELYGEEFLIERPLLRWFAPAQAPSC
jgi:MoxR-like ATPase